MKTTIIEYLEETALRFPDKIAFSDLKEAFTFSSLLETSKRIGTCISYKVAPRNPIVVYMDKKAYNIAAFLGIAYAGCFYVPIDNQMPSERVNLIIETLNPSLIIYDKITEKKLNEFSIPKINYNEVSASSINTEALTHIRQSSKTTDLLYVLFTSGSTGIPKGVTISHLAVIDFMEWVCKKYSINENNILCNQAPFYFDASVPDIYIPLKTGATVYIPPKIYYTFPNKILQFIVDKEINTLVWVPSALCNVVNCKAFNLIIPSTIKLVIFCGEVMPCKHLNIWRKYVPDALYVNMYGPTEATYACMYYNVEREFDDDEKLPLGKACENSEILLITEDDILAKKGEIGEICILGQCLSSGYYNDPNKTAKTFVQNPANDKWIELMYRTGDLAYRDGNTLIFAGRKDFQIKRLGHRIELGEIEATILSINSIENACCLFNSSTNEIIVVYTGAIDSKDLSALLEKKLPHYMLPSKYEYITTMPMNLNGKIDRRKLQETYIR